MLELPAVHDIEDNNNDEKTKVDTLYMNHSINANLSLQEMNSSHKYEKHHELRAIEKQPRFELETFTCFSQSHLWKLMMSFYDRQGVDSWSQGIVPHFITCNSFIGHAYAKPYWVFSWIVAAVRLVGMVTTVLLLMVIITMLRLPTVFMDYHWMPMKPCT